MMVYWCQLEGIERVMVAYRVWRDCKRDLRHARKNQLTDLHKRILKEDVQIEFEELTDSILSLSDKEHLQLLKTVKNDKLYRLMVLYK